MGHLDDLKRQRNSLQQQDEQSDNKLEELKIRQQLRTGLHSILEYLEELVSILHEVKPQIVVSYHIEGVGELTELHQHDYEIEVDDRDDIKKITLSLECIENNGRERIVTVDGRDAFLRQREYMWKSNLYFKEKVSVDGRGTFFIEPRIPIQFIFTPNPKQGNIKLQIRNLAGIGLVERYLSPEKINQDSLDHDLGGLILRKIKDLDQLSTGKMTEELRKQIREGLKREREKAQQQIEEMLATQEREQEDARLSNKIRRKLNELSPEASEGLLKKMRLWVNRK